MQLSHGLIISAALTLGLVGTASAQDCSTTVGTDDSMRYDTFDIVVDQDCEEFTVTLTHTGVLDRESMGHNWVLSEEADVQDLAIEGEEAGLENDYVPPDDDRVIAYTEVIGGGEQTAVTFPVDALDPDTEYTFFCSFPGHAAAMRGSLSVM